MKRQGDQSLSARSLPQRVGNAVGLDTPASVINILDPEVVVLGGGVSNVEALYTRGIETLRQWVFNDELHTRIARNELGDSAGVFGAAMLTAPDRSEQA